MCNVLKVNKKLLKIIDKRLVYMVKTTYLYVVKGLVRCLPTKLKIII
jgi:hypothetical protein